MHFLGMQGMPRRIPDYPDAFTEWNQVCSFGSWITVLSMVIFFVLCYDVLTTDRQFISWKKEILNVLVHSTSYHQLPLQISKLRSLFSYFSFVSFVMLVNTFQVISSADSPESWGWDFQDSASPVMERIIEIFYDLFFLLWVIVGFVFWMLLRTMYLYHSSRLYIHRSNISYNEATILEIVWTLIPTILLILVAIPSFALLYSSDEWIDPTLSLKIIRRQWYWTYEYSDFVTINKTTTYPSTVNFDSYLISEDDLEIRQFRLLETDNRVVLPAHVHVRLLITASDVMHSWALPSAGIKVDAVPGRLNETMLYLNREGVFYGQCSELCGVQHRFMPICVESVNYDAFTHWLFLKTQED